MSNDKRKLRISIGKALETYSALAQVKLLFHERRVNCSVLVEPRHLGRKANKVLTRVGEDLVETYGCHHLSVGRPVYKEIKHCSPLDQIHGTVC